MWPFSKNEQPPLLVLAAQAPIQSAVDELIKKIERLVDEDPDGWRFEKINYFHWFYKDSGVFITQKGELGTKVEKDFVCITGNEEQKAEVATLENNLAAHKALRSLFREEV